MSDSADLRKILKAWPYDPEHDARIIRGEDGLEVLQVRTPLGIEHPTWETSPQGITTGGYGLSIRTEDIAKLGLLYLQRGRWEGTQLIPEAWVAEATSKQVGNADWRDGDFLFHGSYFTKLGACLLNPVSHCCFKNVLVYIF